MKDAGAEASSEICVAVNDAAGTPPEASDERERRRHKRYACDGRAEVFLPHGGMLIRGRILDVSASGCFIEAPTINLERGTHVEVYFESNRLQFRVSGSIAILHPRSGVGILFLDLSLRSTRQLQQLIEELPEAS